MYVPTDITTYAAPFIDDSAHPRIVVRLGLGERERGRGREGQHQHHDNQSGHSYASLHKGIIYYLIWYFICGLVKHYTSNFMGFAQNDLSDGFSGTL